MPRKCGLCKKEGHNRTNCENAHYKGEYNYKGERHGKGTYEYKLSKYNKTSLKKTIEWNQNKLFLFKRTDNSWHNFNALGLNTPRVVYNLNIFKKGYLAGGGEYKKIINR